jgi:hypothetical protein
MVIFEVDHDYKSLDVFHVTADDLIPILSYLIVWSGCDFLFSHWMVMTECGLVNTDQSINRQVRYEKLRHCEEHKSRVDKYHIMILYHNKNHIMTVVATA